MESEQPPNCQIRSYPHRSAGRAHKLLLSVLNQEGTGKCDGERPKLVGRKPGRSSCSQNALARSQLRSVPKLISLPGARTSLLGGKNWANGAWLAAELCWKLHSPAVPWGAAAWDKAARSSPAARMGIRGSEMWDVTWHEGLCPLLWLAER